MVCEWTVLSRREREYKSKNGTVQEHLVVLWDADVKSPLDHSVDFAVETRAVADACVIGSKVRIAVTSFQESEFGRRKRISGSIVK